MDIREALESLNWSLRWTLRYDGVFLRFGIDKPYRWIGLKLDGWLRLDDRESTR